MGERLKRQTDVYDVEFLMIVIYQRRVEGATIQSGFLEHD